MTKKIVTHSGGFHADDVFGVAALSLLLGEEHIEVIRSRDQAVIDSGEYVLDVGFVYDPDTNRFDHHQKEGAGVRDNGIPYASFGLIWKQYGETITGSKEIADAVDERLVQQIDAYDNGVGVFSLDERSVPPFLLQDVVALFEPVFRESRSNDEGFTEARALAKRILERLILLVRGEIEIKHIVAKAYDNARDKHLVIFDESFVADRVLIARLLGEYTDTLYFVRKHEGNRWQLVCVVNSPMFYNNRKLLPVAWHGRHEAELVAITGVSDAYFCHRSGFMAVADSKEGTLKLAELALNS